MSYADSSPFGWRWDSLERWCLGAAKYNSRSRPISSFRALFVNAWKVRSFAAAIVELAIAVALKS